jgi:hypothetical protein
MEIFQSLKQWFEKQPALARWVGFPLALVVVNAVIVGVICLIRGTTDAMSLSNALFYDSALVMLIALILYFANRQSGRPSLRELTSGEPPKREGRRPADPMPFYATTIFLAGLVVFGLSILITYIGGLA